MKHTILPLLLILLVVVGIVEMSQAASPGPSGVRIGRRVGGSGSSTGIGTGGTPEDPKVTRERIIAACQKKIDRIHSLIRQEKYGVARQDLDSAWALCITTDLQKQLEDLKVKLEEIALKLLKQTDQLYRAGQYAQALESYKRLNRLFATLQAGAMARQAITAAERDPACQAALEEHQAKIIDNRVQKIIDTHNKLQKNITPAGPKKTTKPVSPAGPVKTETPAPPSEKPKPSDTKEPVASSTLVKPNGQDSGTTPSPIATGTLLQVPTRSESIRRLPPDKQVQAMKYMLQIVEKYPRTILGQQAAKDLQDLGSDPELMDRIQSFEKQKKVRQLFSKAEMFHKSNMTKPALNAYQQIAEQFPKTPEAEIARERITALGGKLPDPK